MEHEREWWAEEADLIGRLKAKCREFGSQKAWADMHGFSAAYVSDILNRRRAIGENIAMALGFECKRVFREFEP